MTDEPLYLGLEGDDMEIDIGAEKIIVAEKGLEKIAVEVKSFIQPSLLYTFHQALGQYLNYLIALKEAPEKRELYLAISIEVFRKFKRYNTINKSIKNYNVNLLIFDLTTQNIIQWIK